MSTNMQVAGRKAHQIINAIRKNLDTKNFEEASFEIQELIRHSIQWKNTITLIQAEFHRVELYYLHGYGGDAYRKVAYKISQRIVECSTRKERENFESFFKLFDRVYQDLHKVYKEELSEDEKRKFDWQLKYT